MRVTNWFYDYDYDYDYSNNGNICIEYSKLTYMYETEPTNQHVGICERQYMINGCYNKCSELFSQIIKRQRKNDIRKFLDLHRAYYTDELS